VRWSAGLALERIKSALRRKPLAARGVQDEDHPIDQRQPRSKEPIMSTTRFDHLLHRAFSFCLAATVTLAMLGGIDQLSQPEAQSPQWAQQSSPRA
jgi:hypothetical protein